MSPLRCGCGAEVIPGALWTEEDAAAWRAEHADCPPVEPVLRAVSIRCASPEEAREFARDLRRMHVVGRVEASLYVRPREVT